MPSPKSSRKNHKFKLEISKLLDFYDVRRTPNEDTGSPITAITSLIGEDLVLGLLELYFKKSGRALQCPVERKCTTGETTGPRLDGWIRTKKGDLFQTEVKNWCASAIGGISVDKDLETKGGKAKSRRRRYSWFEAAERNRERYLNHPHPAKNVWKVLVPMKQRNGRPHKNAKPLLAFWSAIAPQGASKEKQLKPFFSIRTKFYRDIIREAELPLPRHYSDTVWIFSASNYLRSLKGKGRRCVEISMPRVRERLEELRKLGFPIKL